MKALAIIAIVLGGTTGFALGWLDAEPRRPPDDAAGEPAIAGSGNAGAEPSEQGTGAEQRLMDALAAADLDASHWPRQSPADEVAGDPAAEFQAALEMSNVMARRHRIRAAVIALAGTNPLLALDLIETIPNELMRRGMFRLAVDIWAEKSPTAAAEWLVDAPPGIGRLALPSVAAHWGSRDFRTASAFADRLAGTLRTTYLYRLARIERPAGELLAWAKNYRTDSAFPGIVERVVGQLGDDVDAVVTLLGELSEPALERGKRAAIYQIARANPDAALELAATSTGNVWRTLYPDLIHGFAEKSPERAAAFLAERFAASREEPRHLIMAPSLLSRLLSTWANADPDAAFTWSLSLDPSWLRDDALAAVAVYAHAEQPAIARRAFEAIAEERGRWRAIDRLITIAASDEEAFKIVRDYGYTAIDREEVVHQRSSDRRFRTINVDCPRDAIRYGVR